MTSKAKKRKKGHPIKFIGAHNVIVKRPDMGDVGHFKLDGVYCRLIPLTKGLYVIVWESDYEWAIQWEWYAFSGGGYSPCYYAARKERGIGKKRTIFMHNEILGLPANSSLQGDHIRPYSTLRNTRDNLRSATPSQNTCNRKINSNNTSGYKGVSWYYPTGKWRAVIQVEGKQLRLGYFNTKEEAYAAYCEAALKYYGEFARLK
jgi:hypothetical protein